MTTEKAQARIPAFGGLCQLLIDSPAGRGDELLSLTKREIERLEHKFSYYETDSVIGRINHCAGTGIYVTLDAESRSLFDYVTALWEKTDSLFDPTTELLQHCYDGDGHLHATDTQLQGMLKLVNWGALEITSNGARLSNNGMIINLNSCIRPYAVDCIRNILSDNGVMNALIAMDQDIATIGRQADGANWMIAVRYPKGSRAAITRIKLNNKGYAVRGDFERRVSIDGSYFGRALSPKDGKPIAGLLAAAVIAENCLTAGSAASIARLKPEPAGLEWLSSLDLPWLAIDRQLNCHGPLAERIGGSTFP